MDYREVSSITILFSDDQELHNLNKKYRGKDKSTDVLSFISTVENYLGDIVISVPVAVKQAKAYGVTLLDELTRLIVHGVLHLLGYEHEHVSSSVARSMRKKEEELFQLLIQ